MQLLTGRIWWCCTLVLLFLVSCGSQPQQQKLPDPPAAFELTSVSGFCVDVKDAGVKLAWSAPEGASTIEVWRDSVLVAELGGTETAYTDTDGLLPGATVTYQLRAVNAGGASETSEVELDLPSDLCDGLVPAPPGAVGELSVSAECIEGGASLQLDWSPVAGAAHYLLERDYVQLAELPADVSSYVDSGVLAGEGYTYALRAVNAAGVSLGQPVAADVPFDVCVTSGTVLAAHSDYNLLIAENGSVWGWGYFWAGSVVPASVNDVHLPMEVPGLTATSVALSEDHILALDAQGQVWAWGDNWDGQLGVGEAVSEVRSPTVVEGLPPAVDIAAGHYHSLVLAADGTVWTFGYNGDGQLGKPFTFDELYVPQPVEGLSGVRRVWAGYDVSYALLESGELLAWGENDEGQLGVGDFDSRYVPKEVILPATAVEVAVGRDFTLFVLEDGSLYGAGEGEHLGIGMTTDVHEFPVQVPVPGDVVGAAAGRDHALAIMADGTLYGWGDNGDRQAADVSDSFVYDPQEVAGVSGVVAAAAGEDHSVVLTAAGELYAWGSNDENQLGWNLPETVIGFTEVPLDAQVQQLSSYDHALLLTDASEVWAWGRGSNGRLGLGDTRSVSVPTKLTSLPPIVSVAAGDSFSLALDNTGQVWSWGYNVLGQLGLGDTDRRLTPQLVAGLSNVMAISAGSQHALALLTDGTVWSWGYNYNGQLGIGNTTNQSVPVQVTLPGNAMAVAAGVAHSAVLLDDGTVWSFGARRNGAMGDGGPTSGNQLTPVKANTADVAAVAAGAEATFVLHTNGTLSSWGLNDYGQLGVDTDVNSENPVSITELPHMASVRTQDWTVLAQATNGALYGWGRARDGELGSGTAPEEWSPVLLNVPGSVDYYAPGYRHSFVVVDGVLMATGRDRYGNLGIGRLLYSDQPRLIETLPRAALY